MPEGARFLGLEIPFEAQQALRTLPTLDSLDAVLEQVLAHTLGVPASADVLKALSKATALDSGALGALFAGLHWLVRACMRSSLKPKALVAELADARVHAPFVEAIVKAVEKGRSSIAPPQLAGDDALPTLDELRWCLDVTISTSALHRVLRPQLTLQTELSDGSAQAFHASRPRFNELRYVAAKCLKEIEDLESRLPALP